MHFLDYTRERLRGELLLKGSSLASVARDLNLDYQTVYAVISGARSRRVETRISQVLGKPVEEIWPSRYPQARAE